MNSARKPTITAANLTEALHRHVALEGRHLGKGIATFFLNDLLKPSGSEIFTEVYFTTASESFYRICKQPIVRGNWVLQGKRQGTNLPDYPLSPYEMQNASINIGVPFPFGTRLTGNVLAILAVDTDHAYTIEHVLRHSQAESNIRAEFDRL